MRQLAFDYAYMGEKDLALKLAERAVMLRPVLKMRRPDLRMKRTWQ